MTLDNSLINLYQSTGTLPDNSTTAACSPDCSEGRSVLLVGNFLSGSNVNRSVCEDLSIRLSATGWRVITTSRKVERLARLLDMVGTAWAKRKEYSLAHVDVYSGLQFIWAEAACAALRRARKPYVLTLRGGNLPAFASRWPRRLRRLLGSAAAVTTPSRYLLDHMTSYRSDLILLPNPLDLDAYRFRHREVVLPNLVWVRAFHEIYNPALAPQVVSVLKDEFPDIHLTMLGPDKGDGSWEETMKIARDLGVAESVTLVGSVPKEKVPRWLEPSDIFLNTTWVDNTPISVLEAMACGLCVVSTNVGGIPYLLEDECDALLAPPGDAATMAAAVRRLLTEPGLGARLSQCARKRAEGFNWSVVLPQWAELLTEVTACSGN